MVRDVMRLLGLVFVALYGVAGYLAILLYERHKEKV